MKTKMIAFLMVLLLIVLAGCNNTPSNEDKLIDDFNLNNLPVFRNVYIIDGFIKHESGRLLDFTDIPVSVRHILKGEAK